jgi:predicted alpha/beta-hydrolase family hydrolase
MGVNADGSVQLERFSFEVGDAATTALVYAPASAPPRATLVLGHGAGAPQTHPWMVAMAGALATRGLQVVTFNFLYAEGKRRVPDRPPVLEATWRAALAAVRTHLGQTSPFIGGKSMGGRIATQVAAQPDVDVAGLVLLGYPLHPPGKPAQLRTAHLPGVRAPMLFVQGSRDAFGGADELAPFLVGLSPGTRLFAVEGGDHSLAVPRSLAAGKASAPGSSVVLRPAERLAMTMDRVAEEIAHFTGSR